MLFCQLILKTMLLVSLPSGFGGGSSGLNGMMRSHDSNQMIPNVWDADDDRNLTGTTKVPWQCVQYCRNQEMIPEAQSLFVVAVNTGDLWSTCRSSRRNRVDRQKGWQKKRTKEGKLISGTCLVGPCQIHQACSNKLLVLTPFSTVVSLFLSSLCQGSPSLTLAGISLNSSCSHRNLRVSGCCVTLSSCARNACAARAQKRACEGMYSTKRPWKAPELNGTCLGVRARCTLDWRDFAIKNTWVMKVQPEHTRTAKYSWDVVGSPLQQQHCHEGYVPDVHWTRNLQTWSNLPVQLFNQNLLQGFCSQFPHTDCSNHWVPDSTPSCKKVPSCTCFSCWCLGSCAPT